MANDPFSTLGALDQKLFQATQQPVPPVATSPVPVSQSKPQNRASAVTRNRISMVPPNRTSAEPRKSGTAEPAPVPPVQVSSPGGFDISERPYKAHGFLWTKEELWALKDTASDIERSYDVATSMQDLIRCALHLLVEDYRQRKETSEAVRRIVRKKR